MLRNFTKDTAIWSAFRIFCLLILAESVSANKQGYYGKFIGKLSQLHHGVSGDVYAVDAKTLHLRNFNYDGEGPAAFFYAGTTKAPGPGGFRLRDERGTTNVLPRYRNKHITIELPEGKTLQNIRWFSVWCDEFSVNFGDVKIPKNFDFPKPHKINGLSGVHGVSSDPIIIVDAQSLMIPNFSYDGEAPDAKFWVGRGPKPSPQGIRIPDENEQEVPLHRYDRRTIVLVLPGDLTIFDIGHFGVWCEAFTVDFGHVQIPRGLNVPPSLKMLGIKPQKRSPSIAVPLAVQNGFENHFGNQQTNRLPVNNPIFNQGFNNHAFQEIRPTTYKPLFLPPATPNFHNGINRNNHVEVQRSISLSPNNEFFINEQTGDFVKKPFDVQQGGRQDFRYEPTPAEKILRHNPAEPTAFYRNGFSGTSVPARPSPQGAGLLASPAFAPPQPQPQFQPQPQHLHAPHHFQRLAPNVFDGRPTEALPGQQRPFGTHTPYQQANAFGGFPNGPSNAQTGFYKNF